MSAGKGDKRRPSTISREEFEKRWNKIFKNKPSRPKDTP